ncbi:MAG: ADP-glyceromanno-heptose 6-epimerase [Desulfuromonadaceae bacterium]|nr:ADP-glyceromanno-heptose 6-epimerase [Desulfuromonadaceae bacterium]
MIIVTGGAGFIGSALVWRLNQLGYDNIVIVDSLGTSEKWRNLVPLRYADYVEKDDFLRLAQGDSLHQVCDFGPAGIEAIFHMGACSATTETDSRYLVQNNFEYTKHMALLARHSDARFIYASSAATYGDGANGFVDAEDELDNLRPLNMYGYSKQMFDLWARREGMLDSIAGLKFFNVFGPNEYHKESMRSLVIKAYEQIMDSGKISLFKSYRPEYADGEQKRDFVYIKDVVDMTLFFFKHPEVNGIFNIGSSSAHTWNELAGSIFSALKRIPSIEYIDMPDDLRSRYQYYTCSDVTKLRDAGYTGKQHTLDSAVYDYVVNYLQKSHHLGQEKDRNG